MPHYRHLMISRPIRAVGAALLLAALTLGSGVPTPAYAAAISVNTTLDAVDGTDGLCSLREAVVAASSDTAERAK